MTKLQNPTRVAFEAVNASLKEASGTQKKLGKALDKVGDPPLHVLSLPTTDCAVAPAVLPPPPACRP